MSKVKIQGHASGSGVITVTAPNTSTDRTITLPDSTGTLATTADVPAGITSSADGTAITIGSDEIVSFSSHVMLVDNGYVVLGAGEDLKINSDGTNGVINAAQGYLALQTGSVQRLRVDSDGLKFNADTAAANALDDYEEGTWTVGWTSTSNTFNPSTTTGYYTKVGNLVTISYHAYLSGAPTINASANGFSFTGLPFTSSSGKSSTITWGHKRWMEWPSNTTDVMLDIEGASTTIQTLARTSIGELYNIRAVTFSRNGSGISFAGHYYTDS